MAYLTDFVCDMCGNEIHMQNPPRCSECRGKKEKANFNAFMASRASYSVEERLRWIEEQIYGLNKRIAELEKAST